MTDLQRFCRIVRQRSEENKKAMSLLVENKLLGNAVSVLRQELDSMVRVIYLLSCPEDRRATLIKNTLDGAKWNVTDRAMVDYSNQYWGWTQFVYKFGCAFIHLSQFHEYLTEDPFSKISDADKQAIIGYLHQYHEFPMDGDLTALTLEPYLLKVFEKVSDNMLYELEKLERGCDLETDC
jgi:hypothetical protein